MKGFQQAVVIRQILVLVLLFPLVSCVGVLPPENYPVPDIAKRAGYRSAEFPRRKNDIQLLLSFSGGGIRAAALSYGVLQELHRTPLPKRGNLLDEVDYISSVSGGSFTAAYYGLFGDEIFERYEKDFLKKSIQSALLKKIISPGYWYSSVFSGWNRTEMAADYYDKTIFRGKKIGDILRQNRAFIEINATELSHGGRFSYTQEFFDLICSDVSAYSVAKAVTASSAVPVLFPPVPLKNYADKCSYRAMPALYNEDIYRRLSERQKELVKIARLYRDAEQNPFLHLVDGGIADNLGVHAMLDRLSFRFEDVSADAFPRHLVIIMVNAEVKPANGINNNFQPPSISETVTAITDNMMNRYSFESRNLIEERIEALQEKLRKAGSTTKIYLVKVDFESIKQPTIKRYFNNLPTSLELKDNEIDNVISVGRNLLRDSVEYRQFLDEAGLDALKASHDSCFLVDDKPDCSFGDLRE